MTKTYADRPDQKASTKTNKMQGVGLSHDTLYTSAGLQPARLVRRGDRAFTRRMAKASIGLKPMRLAVHHTQPKYISIISWLD